MLSSGRPLDNCIIYLIDKDLQLVPQGEVGELVVAGRNLAAGYIRGRDPYRFINNPHVVDPGKLILIFFLLSFSFCMFSFISSIKYHV